MELCSAKKIPGKEKEKSYQKYLITISSIKISKQSLKLQTKHSNKCNCKIISTLVNSIFSNFNQEILGLGYFQELC